MKRNSQHEISTEELKSFLGAIKIRFGIDFTQYEMKSLKRGFGRILSRHQMDSIYDLWKILLRDRHFIKSCIDELTVNMTEMFRNPEIWMTIQEAVGERWKQEKELSIWHAGCSSGEEVYSMAWVLHQLNLTQKTKVLATDLNASVLDIARQGNYTSHNAKKYRERFSTAFEDNRIDSLLEPGASEFQIRHRLKKNITFKTHNLVSDDYPQQMDIIFCRNVMIYFDEQLKLSTMKKLYDALNPNGWLIIGFYDTMPLAAKKWYTSHQVSAKIYQKIG